MTDKCDAVATKLGEASAAFAAVTAAARFASAVVTVGTAGAGSPLGLFLLTGSLTTGLASVVTGYAAGYIKFTCREGQDGPQPPAAGGNFDPTTGTNEIVRFESPFVHCIPKSVTVEGGSGTTGVYCYVPPIVIDLGNDGVSWRDNNNAITGDLAHNEPGLEKSSWVGSNEGVMFFDANGDGIGQHEEAILKNWSMGANTDLDALRTFDTNRNGSFDAGDAAFTRMKIGRDFNQDGHFGSGEVYSLSGAGISSIQLFANVTNYGTPETTTDNVAAGITLFNTGRVIMNDGSSRTFYDVAFQMNSQQQLTYNDGTAKVFDAGAGVKSLYWNSGAALNYDMSGVTYFGQGGFYSVTGSETNDSIVGNSAGNVIVGRGGYDTLLGQDGDDTVVASTEAAMYGNVQGGNGKDTLIISSSSGVTFNANNRGFEVVIGGTGADSLSGGESATLHGRDGNDILTGGVLGDVLVGGAGSDRMAGHTGDDVIVADENDDMTFVTGGLGFDTLAIDWNPTATYVNYGYGGWWYTPGVNVNMVNQGFEAAFGSGGDDTIYANGGTTWDTAGYIQGGKGNDTIYGSISKRDNFQYNRGDGSDTLYDDSLGILTLGEGIKQTDVHVTQGDGYWTISISATAAGNDGGTITLVGTGGNVYDVPQTLNVEGVSHYIAHYEGNVWGWPPPPPGDGGGGGGSGGGGGGGGGGGAIPPVILDLDGDGVELIAPKKSGIFFDYDEDGTREETGWVSSDDGILVRDLGWDDQVSSFREFAFGTAEGPDGTIVSDLEGLRKFDSNQNGLLDRSDALYGTFKVWQDANSNAVSDAGELITLKDAGVLAIRLDGTATGQTPEDAKDNVLYATSNWIDYEGQSHAVGDVFFAYRDARGNFGHSGHKKKAAQGQSLQELAPADTLLDAQNGMARDDQYNMFASQSTFREMHRAFGEFHHFAIA